jgi:hypothetical protein
VDAPLFGRVGGLSIAILLVLGAAQPAEADVGGTDVWTMVGAPSFSTGGNFPFGVVSFSNHLSFDVPGIVIMVLRNNLGQTVYFSTGTVTIASGAIAAVELVEFGLAPGTYNATFFAITFGGVAISPLTSALFTLPGPT